MRLTTPRAVSAFFILCLIGLAPATYPVFAGDALTPEAGVLRAHLFSSYFYTAGSFNDAGALDDNPLDANAVAGERPDVVGLNIGAAVELGILDWLSAYIQWFPGYTVWSDYAAADGTTDIPGGVLGFENADINGYFDVTAGAQFEMVGVKGLLKSRRFRVLAGPQVVVPMPNPDYQAEIDRAEDGGDWSINTAKHVFGLGGRLTADLIISELVFINLLADFIYHFPGDKASYLDPTQTRTVRFGYTLIAELEPRLVSGVDPGLRVGFGLPARIRMSPPPEVDGQTRQDESTLLLSLSPAFSLYLDSPLVPLEIELSYGVPLWGRNALNQRSVKLQVTTDIRVF